MNIPYRLLLLQAFILFLVSCGKTAPSPIPDNPDDLIRSYYEAAGRLDYEYMETCVRRPGKDTLIREVSNVATLTRIRRGTENREVFLPARQWIESGQESIPAYMVLYGITDIRIEPLGGGSYTVSYRKWSGENGDIQVQDISEKVEITAKRTGEYLRRF